MYLLINCANGYFQEKNEKKYVTFESTDEKKELLKKYSYVWNGIEKKIEPIRSCKCDYEKEYMEIKFNSD